LLEAGLAELEAELAAASKFRSSASAALESASDHADGISLFLDAFETSVSSLERLSLSGLVGARESVGSLKRCEGTIGRERAQAAESEAELERRGAEVEALKMELEMLEGRLRDAVEALDEERDKGEGAVAFLSESLRSQGDAMADKEEQVLSLEAKLKDGESAIGLLSASLIQMKEREGALSDQVWRNFKTGAST
jgi:chromosome segregation ATPase